MVKVGDRVRCNIECTDMTVGKVYTVSVVDGQGSYDWAVRDDDGDENFQISESGAFELVSANEPDELNELRAFRDRALARFPALAEPETDDDAAERFCKHYELRDYGDTFNAVRDAITWARANPR